MLSSLLMISLLAAPRAPVQAEVVASALRLEALSSLLPFFNAAGSRSALLRPRSWSEDAHPLIDVDVTDPAALALAGIDATGPLTRSRLGDSTLTCVRLSDVNAYRLRCDARLARLGEALERVEAGVTLSASRDPLGRVMAAYGVVGRESCAITGHGRSVELQLPALAQTLGKVSGSAGLALAAKVPAALQLIVPSGTPHGAVGLNTQALTLTADARLKGAPLAQFAGPGASPFGGFTAPGMAVVRARFAKAGFPAVVQQLVRQFPGASALSPLAHQLAPVLTGNAAGLISHVKVTTGLRTKEARFFAVKFALLLEVADVAAAASVVSSLDPKGLAFREGNVSVTLEGAVLLVSNDASARATALTKLPQRAGRQAHGLEFDVEPGLLARGLQQVPLLEAVQAPELAGLLAASTELGPLLLATKRVSGWLDSNGGQHTGRLVWALDEAKFSPDAGM